MKKKWLLIMALAGALTLTGACKGKEAETEQSTAEAETAEEMFSDSKVTKLGTYKEVKVPPKKTVVEQGDTVNIAFIGRLDGEAFEGGTAESYDLTIGSGAFIPGFEEGLIGKEVGGTYELPLTFPEEYSNNPDLAGKEVVFEVTVHEIQDVSPEEYVLQAFIESSEFDCAESDLESIKAYMRQEYEGYAASAQMELKDFLAYYYGLTEEEFETIIAENAETALKSYLAVQAIIDAEQISVNEEEYTKSLSELAETYQAESPEAFEEQYGREMIEENLIYEKVMSFLAEQAVEN